MYHQYKHIESYLEGDLEGEDPIEDDSLKNEVEETSTLFFNVKFDDTLSKDLEKDDPINSLEINIGLYI